MIKFKDTISIQKKRNGDLVINSDRGDSYNTFSYANSKTLITDWWKDQYQTELREWQKDIVIGYPADALGKGIVFNIYKPGQGYSQAHDMCLFHHPDTNCWVFATQDCYWIQFTDEGQVVFDRADSLGSVMIKEDRFLIGNVWDGLKKQYNPENRVHWVKA